MKTIRFLFIVCLVTISTLVFSQKGDELFKSNCASCHTIGKGTLTGPDLKNVLKRHPEQWLIRWIKSSQTLVTKKDKIAVELFEKNNQIIMPDQDLAEQDIKSLLTYIRQESEHPEIISATSALSQTNVKPEGNQSSQNFTNSGSAASDFANISPYTIFALVSLVSFIVMIIWAMARIINALSNALGEEYRKNNQVVSKQ